MNFNAALFIRKKRNGIILTESEISEFVQLASTHQIPDYQVTAFLMATYFQGMNAEETSFLTKSMVESGKRISFNDSKTKVDKHSTGGIGDKVSIVLAPVVASCGIDVPMVAGRGLGHTGGTLDKLESIPGFKVHLPVEKFKDCVKKNGTAIVGQTEEFVPADKLFYALRDVTATVESIPLITASILSKKVAEGISALVMDIKVGSGAFMKNMKDAERLAKSIIKTGKKLGLKIRALITDMNQPLGYAIGNSLEVLECLDFLDGKGPQDLKDITYELAAHMLVLGGKARSLQTAKAMAKNAVKDGKAKERFFQMCLSQGANSEFVEKPRKLLRISPHTLEVLAPKDGVVTKIANEDIGHFVTKLGGGRLKASDPIDASVGLLFYPKLGQKLKKGELIAKIFYNPTLLEQKNLSASKLSKEIQKLISITKTSKGFTIDLVKKVLE